MSQGNQELLVGPGPCLLCDRRTDRVCHGFRYAAERGDLSPTHLYKQVTYQYRLCEGCAAAANERGVEKARADDLECRERLADLMLSRDRPPGTHWKPV